MKRWTESTRCRVAVVLIGVIAIPLAWAIRQRKQDFREDLTVARYAFLGGDADEAEARYRAALELPADPAGVDAAAERFNRARLHNDLGNLLVSRGDVVEAEEQFARAIERQPSFAPAYNNLAALFLLRDDIGNAQQHLRKALDLQPDAAAAHVNMGVLFARREKWREAHLQIEVAQRLAPHEELARQNLEALGRLRLLNREPLIEPVASPSLSDPWISLRMQIPDDTPPARCPQSQSCVAETCVTRFSELRDGR